MRLGQFARKFNLQLPEIIEFLHQKESFADASFHPNIKLEEATEVEILKHFGIEALQTNLQEEPEESDAKEVDEEHQPVEVPKESNKVDEEAPLSPAEEIAAASGEIEVSETPDTGSAASEKEEQDNKEEDGHTIQTDELLELLESEDPVNLEKIKLIKASKRELSGLKVVGKVELPEPIKKQKQEEKKQEEANQRDKNRKSRQLSEEEKEKRRLKAKRKKEAYEARQEAMRMKKEADRLKKLKEAHYKQKLEQKSHIIAAKKEKSKKNNQTSGFSRTPEKQPKTLLGRFWKWMNT